VLVNDSRTERPHRRRTFTTDTYSYDNNASSLYGPTPSDIPRELSSAGSSQRQYVSSVSISPNGSIRYDDGPVLRTLTLPAQRTERPLTMPAHLTLPPHGLDSPSRPRRYSLTTFEVNQHLSLMEEVKKTIRNGTLRMLDDDRNVDPDQLPMTLL